MSGSTGRGVVPHAATEDYLKAIHQHTEWQDSAITPSQLAVRLGVAPASVTGMIKKLNAAGLVQHEPYGPLSLTAEGLARALAVIRRHRLIETWLVTELGYGWDEVHDEAEVLEHAISDRLLAAIDDRLGHPLRDPHGDAIPAADGSVAETPFVWLPDAHDGSHGRLLRVSDRDPELLRRFAAAGVIPGVDVVVALSDTSTALSSGNGHVELDAADSESVWLTSATMD